MSRKVIRQGPQPIEGAFQQAAEAIATEYTREVSDDVSWRCRDETSYGYTSYDLFALRTRLRPFVRAMFGKDITLQFRGRVEDAESAKDPMKRLVRIVAIPMLGKTEVVMTEEMTRLLQQAVNDAMKLPLDHAVIFDPSVPIMDPSEPGSSVPVSWIRSVIRFVRPLRALPEGESGPPESRSIGPGSSSIDEYLQQFKLATNDGLLYGNLREVPVYHRIYNQMQRDIVLSLLEMWHRGYVANAHCIAGPWKLEQVEQADQSTASFVLPSPQLYRATWYDHRFAFPMSSFLQQRIDGNRNIRLEIGLNNVKRHWVSAALGSQGKRGVPHFFSGPYVYIRVQGVDEARRYASLTLQRAAESNGKSFVRVHSRLSWGKLYSVISRNFWATQRSPEIKDRPCVVYVVDEDRLRFTFSCLVPREMSLSFLNKEFRTRSVRLLAYLNKVLAERPGVQVDDDGNVVGLHELIEAPDFRMPEELVRRDQTIPGTDPVLVMGSEALRIQGVTGVNSTSDYSTDFESGAADPIEQTGSGEPAA